MAKAIDYSKMTAREAEQAAYAERTESGSRYRRFCEAVAANAKGYKTKKACDLMIGRVVALWKRRGSYGIEKTEMENAVWEIRFRWMELHGMEMDARWAS